MLVAALILLLLGREREPRFQGKTLSVWLLRRDPHLRTLTIDQDEAIRSMGTNVLPFLLKWMQYESPPWRARLARSVPRVFAGFSFLFRDSQEERAELSQKCLCKLGPDVSPAIPELVKMMKQTNGLAPVRALLVVDSTGLAGIPVLLDVLTNRQVYGQDRAYMLRGTMSHLGPDGHYAVPGLLTCLTNKDTEVAATAATLLGQVRMEPELAVPALLSCLDSPDPQMRYAAVRALGEFRGYARVAIPFVVRTFSDPDNGIREAATNALQMIEADYHFRGIGSGQSF